MKAPVAWLREFVELPASATVEEIARRIADVGFEVAGIEGDVIDFEVTANRPDCLSVRGLAREAAAAFGAGPGSRFEVQGSGPNLEPRTSNLEPGTSNPVPVAIESALCGRYAL